MRWLFGHLVAELVELDACSDEVEGVGGAYEHVECHGGLGLDAFASDLGQTYGGGHAYELFEAGVFGLCGAYAEGGLAYVFVEAVEAALVA